MQTLILDTRLWRNLAATFSAMKMARAAGLKIGTVRQITCVVPKEALANAINKCVGCFNNRT